MKMLIALARIVFGTPHRKIASLLIVGGMGLVGQDLVLLVLEAAFQVTIPEMSQAATIWTMIIGGLCIVSGITIFVYFQRSKTIVPDTKGFSISLPNDLTFEAAYNLIARQLSLGIRIKGFSAEEMNSEIETFTVTGKNVTSIPKIMGPYIKRREFPEYRVQEKNGVIIVKREI